MQTTGTVYGETMQCFPTVAIEGNATSLSLSPGISVVAM